MKEINEGEFASIFPDIALFLDKMVNGDKYKKAIRGYLNWRRTNPSQGLRGITKFAKMTGLRAKDLDIVLHKLIKQGKLPKHLAIHENERKDSEIMMAEKKKFKDIRKDDPCWDGYKQVGMKKKNGKEVPNCVPEETEITEMKLPISDEMFKSLKKGDKIKINFDSSIKKGNENTYVVKSKSKSAKYNLEKIALKNVANPVAQASYLYNRQGKVTMAQGDMAVTMNSVVKEAVSALGDYQANLNPDSSKPLGGKIVRPHLVKPYKNRKHASRWMGVVDDFDDAVKKYPRKAVRELGKKDQWGNKIVQIWENENIELNLDLLEGLDSRQIALLKKNYSTIDRVDPSGPAYKKAKGMIAGLDKDMQMDLAKAKVKFLSQIAADELRKQHGVKLKAKDYMESLSFSDLRKNLEESSKESVELDEAIDFRKAHQEIMAYAKKSGGIDKTDFEKVAYYVKAIGDNQNTPNVANKAFMAMKKFVGDMDTDPRDGVMLMLKKYGMMKNGRLVQESITEGALGKQWVNGAKRVKSGSITLVKAKNPAADLHTVMKNGKKVGTFVFDDGPDAFSVTNMSTKKVSWADQIDDIPKMFESKAPALKSSDYAKGTYQSAQAFKDRFAKKKKAPALKSSDYPKGTSMSATAWKKKHESVDEASKEGTVRIIDLGNKGQDKIRKELGVDKLPNKGFQVQVMTKGKFVNQGKPYKTMKDAEKVRSTGQHSMQFDEAALEEKTKWKMGDGRPRNGPRIENDRFWNLPYDSLKYIAKDAGEAMKANPTARKATTGPGNWADQVADAATVMQWRKKNGIRESVELDKGNQMKTFKNLRESKYAVDIEGLPKFYMDSDSPGKVKTTLRKLLKNPSTLNDVHRVPEGEVKSDFRKRAAGKEEVEESFDDNLEKRAIAVAKKMSDNMTGAVKEIEKIKKGLSKRPTVKKALQLYNEGVDSEFEHQLEESDNKKLAKVIELMDSTESSSEAIKIVAKQMTNGNTAAAKKLITQALKADLGEAKKLDPVGKADADIDNDGDVDKSDEYLHKRRKAVKKAIKKVTKKKSGESEEESKQSSKKLSGKQEKITINPKTEND